MDTYPKQYLYRQIVRGKLYIDENFASDIDLTRIADEACFSKFHFARLFKKIYDKTPHQYLTYVRVEKAKEHLAEDRTVAAACYAVGFDSISSFTGLFKRCTGLTPAAYQQNITEKCERISTRPLEFVPNCFAEKKAGRK
jgi:AraC-type DNA-binding domain-containing proteins